MSHYYLSTLHRSHCLKEAFKAKVSLGPVSEGIREHLVVFLDSRVEVWDIDGSLFRKLFQEDLNCFPKNILKLPSKNQSEDSFLLIESSQVFLVSIRVGRVFVLSNLKLAGRKEMNSYDVLLLSEKHSSQSYQLIIGDDTAQLIFTRISVREDDFGFKGTFTLYLDSIVHDIFPVSLPHKDASVVALFVFLGSSDRPSHLGLLEVDIESKEKKLLTEYKDVNLKTREVSEVFQERLFRIFDIGNKNLLMFCSHSLKIFKLKDSSRVTFERLKLPASESVFVERLPNHGSDSLIFLTAHFVSGSKKTFLYLLEIQPSLDLNDISLTFLGQIPRLVRSPVVLAAKRFLVLSDLEPSEILEIQLEKTGQPTRPFLSQVHLFQNFGLIQQIDIDQVRKQILVNSYRPDKNIQTFQKGLLLEPISQTKFDTKDLIRIQLVTQDPLLFIFHMRSHSVLMKLVGQNILSPEPFGVFKEQYLMYSKLIADIYCAVTDHSLSIFRLRNELKLIFEQSFNPEEAVQAAVSFDSIVVCAHSKKLSFRKLNPELLDIVDIKEVGLEEEPKLLEAFKDKIFLAFWLVDYVEVFSMTAKKLIRVQTSAKGISSLYPLINELNEYVLLVGTNNGSFIHSIVSNCGAVLHSQENQIGRRQVHIRVAGSEKFVALSDESNMLTFSNNFRDLELVPMCHTDLKDLVHFSKAGHEYYILVNKTSISFSNVKSSAVDNFRLKEMKLSGDQPLDKFILSDNRLISFYSNQEDGSSELRIHDVASTLLEFSLPILSGLIECMVTIKFQDFEYLLVGLSLPVSSENRERDLDLDSTAGLLKVYMIRSSELLEVLELPTEKAVRSIQLLENGSCFLLLLGTSQLKVFKLEPRLKKASDRSSEPVGPQIKEILQQKLSYLVDTMSVKDNYILMTDYYWMANVLLFENTRFPRFKSIGRLSSVNSEVVGAEILSPTKFAVSDMSGNLMVFSLAEFGTSESDFIEFQDRNSMRLGEKVLSFKRGSRQLALQFNDQFFSELSNQSLAYLLLGGCSGGLYMLYEIPRKTFILLEDLQSAILSIKESSSQLLKRKDFRRVVIKNRKTKPASGIIDGDVVNCLLHLPDSKAVEILQNMKHSNKPTLASFRDLLRFFDNSPLN